MPTLLPVCAPTHPPTPIPTPSAPLHPPTPLPPPAAGVGGGSVGVVGSVTTWCTHWLCWCCPLPSHTHRACEARGGGGCVWCGCHHHCAPFPPTTTTVCAAPPCPLCVLVVRLGTAAHCGGTHAGVALCLAPDHHTHLPRCPRLSPLSSLLPPNPPSHTHKWHCSLHTHMACFVCLVPSTHSHTGCLTAHTPSTHTGGCACAHPPALMRHHTHSAGTGVALAWLLWCCGHHHHAPCATHTHTGTGGGRHGGGWWWACGHCVAATPRHPLALPATTHATSTTTHTMACCLFGTPCHSHHHHSTPSHTRHNSHCATMVVAIGHHAVHTHPTLATHATHTPRASTGVAVAFGVAPPPRWCWPFAVFSSSLLVHQPLSLSLSCTHTPLIPSSTTPPSHPSPVCGVRCGNGLMDGPHCG